MKYRLFTLFFLVVMLSLPGCLKEPDCPNIDGSDGKFRMTLTIGNPRETETRSAAVNGECRIESLVLLRFDAIGNFIEKVELGNGLELSGADGAQSRTLTADVVPIQGDRIVILANYIGSTSDIGNISNLNNKFGIATPASKVYWGKCWSSPTRPDLYDMPALPMSGEFIFNGGVMGSCILYRSLAKVTLTMNVTDQSAMQWGICNILPNGKACIYGSPNQSCSVPSVTDGDFIAVNGPTGSIEAKPLPDYEYCVYLPEYPNATKAKTETVADNVFAAGRTCLIVKGEKGYYRLDLFDHETGKFIDIRRNTHISVTINKVLSNGYTSIEEAMAKPGSNLEYEIKVDGNDDNVVVSNGLYALCLSYDGKIIVGPRDTYDIATVRYKVADGAPRPSDLTSSVISLNIPASVAEVQFTGPISETEQMISLKVTDNTTPIDGEIVVRLGNLSRTILVKRYPIAAYDRTIPYTFTGSMASVKWESPTTIEVVNRGGNIEMTMPAVRKKHRSKGSIFGQMQGRSGYASHISVDAIRQGGIEDIVDMDNFSGQRALFWISNMDADNTFAGNGWIDDPSWSLDMPKDLSLWAYKFTPIEENVSLTLPNTRNLFICSDSEGIPAEWKEKVCADVATKTTLLAKGTPVVLKFKFTKGTYTESFDVTDGNLDLIYPLTLKRYGKASYIAQENFISGFETYFGSQLDYGSSGPLDVSKGQIDHQIDLQANPVSIMNTTIATTDSELGYRAQRVVVAEADKIRTSYYVAQTGLGFSGNGIIKLAKIRTNGAWGYYIPANGEADDTYITDMGGTLLFMIGKTEGLEVTDNNNVAGKQWDAISPRFSWSESSSGNANGIVQTANKTYSSFEFNGTDNPCRMVYPQGYWRAPTTDELKGWALSTDGSPFPIIETYDDGIKLNISSIIKYIDAPMIFSEYGVIGGTSQYTQPDIKGILIGDWYYVYSRPGKGGSLHNVYPMKYIGNDKSNSAPAADVGLGYSHRDACAVLCIRD